MKRGGACATYTTPDAAQRELPYIHTELNCGARLQRLAVKNLNLVWGASTAVSFIGCPTHQAQMHMQSEKFALHRAFVRVLFCVLSFPTTGTYKREVPPQPQDLMRKTMSCAIKTKEMLARATSRRKRMEQCVAYGAKQC
eukprot:3112350-Amphidinium_carterae.1